MKAQKIEVSHRTIIFAIIFILALWFVYFIRDILFQLFVALIIMATLNPLVTKLHKYKFPRAASVIVVYIFVFGVIGGIFFALIPPLVTQTTSFVNNLPRLLDRIGVPFVLSDQVVSQILAQIGTIPSQLVRAVISVFSNVLGVLTVMIFAFYLLLAREKLDEQLGNFFGKEKKKEIAKMVDLLEMKLGGWARGQAFLMFLVGFFTYIGLILLSIPFSLPLAILAGLLEIVPFIGPILSAIPSVIIGFGISPITGMATASLYFLIQQLENYVFVPNVMKRSVGVSPIIVLLALAIGFRLAGVLGVFLSVPVVITLQVLIKQYMLSEK